MSWQSILLMLTALCGATPLGKRGLDCREITIPVKISAQIKILPPTLTYKTLTDYATLLQIYAAASVGITSGSYDIAARYCAPNKVNVTRSKTLQLLVHGVTYTKDYWSGLAPPGTLANQDQYSWLMYAANQGYPTLSIDRLCNGNSSHPNSLLDCQLDLQTEVLHTVAQMARNGKVPTLTTSFNRIVYVGHSYGSMLGNDLSGKYPADIDAYIMSGFSFNVNNSLATDLVKADFVPAAIFQPSRFGFLAADPSYVSSNSENGIQQLFYYGNFDPTFAHYDFVNRGAAALGEIASFLSGQQPAPAYKGILFVLDGNQDLVFCSENAISPLMGLPANCSMGDSSAVHLGYPSVSKFGFYNIPETGHCLNLHRSAQQSFEVAHSFLDSVGF